MRVNGGRTACAVRPRANREKGGQTPASGPHCTPVIISCNRFYDERKRYNFNLRSVSEILAKIDLLDFSRPQRPKTQNCSSTRGDLGPFAPGGPSIRGCRLYLLGGR